MNSAPVDLVNLSPLIVGLLAVLAAVVMGAVRRTPTDHKRADKPASSVPAAGAHGAVRARKRGVNKLDFLSDADDRDYYESRDAFDADMSSRSSH